MAENRTAASETGEPVVHLLDGPKLGRLLKKNKGHLVVLNLWATWCLPCREEVPDLVRLLQMYRSEGLRVILLSTDPPQALKPVRRFLRERNVRFDSYLAAKSYSELGVDSIDSNWSGSLPTTFIFDREGRRVMTLSGRQTLQQLRKVLEPALKIGTAQLTDP